MKHPILFPEWIYWFPIAIWAPIALTLAGLGPLTPFDQLDMPEILGAIDARGGLRSCPMWFVDDWPLGNRLYRPVTACSFAVDRALFGDWAPGYRIVSMVFLLLTACLIARLVREMGGGRGAGALASMLFLMQVTGGPYPFSSAGPAFWYLAGLALTLLGGAALYQRLFGTNRWLPALFVGAGTLIYVVMFDRWNIPNAIRWIATRTVVLCTFFTVASLLLLVRHLKTGRRSLAWACLVCAALAVGAYEQGIVIPALAAAFTWAFTAQRQGEASLSPPRQSATGWSRWTLVAACVAVAIGYWMVRREVLGPSPGVYEAVVFRRSWARVWAWLRYALPPVEAWFWWRWVDAEGSFWLNAAFWQAMLVQLGLIAAVVSLCGTWRTAWPFWWWRAVAFLPMAALRPLDHYLLLSEAGSCALGGLLVAGAIQRAITFAPFACPSRAG